MRVVGIKTLKNRLSEYVRLAAAGETVLVTDRDLVVAELISPRTARPRTASARVLQEEIRQGNIRPPLVPPAGPMPERKPVLKLAALLGELARDREDRV